VNLGIGVYRSDEGKSWPLKIASQVENTIHEQKDIGRNDYLPIAGDPEFLGLARNLIFASTSNSPSKLTDPRIVSVQTLGGTGANHIGARFLAENLRPRCVWLSNPTWANHHVIWSGVGVVRRAYPYYDTASGTLVFTAMMEVLEKES
jgi:aspartate aminotransferase